MKGQYLTVEYIIFFVIGIVMIISVYFIFSNINELSERNTIRSQLRSVGEKIRGTIINILETSILTESKINYNLSIPPRLSTCTYTIEVDNDLYLNCTHDVSISATLSLYNLNITTENIIYSTKGYVEIDAYYNGVGIR